ncbi:hypothetical protein [Halorubrum sp. CSM-61]|uniref:hypothetical protein n=1 Tax=Halorubrum sp. CSM-61 TaxID=2485838 RepID=UPI000F4B7003|nr:hypothetical protein [Halorubrum sp. CSM-61]
MTEDGSDPVDGGEPLDDADDPFDDESLAGSDDLDEVDDPFAELGEGESREEVGTDAEGPLFGEATGIDGRDPVDAGVGDDGAAAGARSRSPAGRGRGETDDPFDELGTAGGETDAELDEAFERMDVGGVAEEDVWDSLDEDAASGFGPVGEFGGAASEADATGSGLGGDFADAGRERVISKRTYCQQCPHFSAPPEVACGHEGTAILEAVGFDEFRVRNCPMVDDDAPTFDAPHEE